MATTTPPDLSGRVALVAGATRGAGRGIAVELGAAGATVYATGRTTAQTRSPMGRCETIEETAALVTAAGGTGIAVQVDHADSEQVRALVQRIERDHGRLDVLVNDIWGGDPLTQWGVGFWEHDLDKGLRMLHGAVDTHIITSHHAVPLMMRSPGGLVLEITDGTGPEYRGSLFYDLVKNSVIRLARAQAEELGSHGIAAVALSPGFLRSEAMLDHFGVTAETWREAIAQDEHFAYSETPHYIGRAAAALAADPDIMQRSGTATATWELYAVYGFTDIDGTTPDWGAHAATLGLRV
jgi:NAD(P)-dependent dehydrogenase (short-subunit alcohol dehydrogenase family)